MVFSVFMIILSIPGSKLAQQQAADAGAQGEDPRVDLRTVAERITDPNSKLGQLARAQQALLDKYRDRPIPPPTEEQRRRWAENAAKRAAPEMSPEEEKALTLDPSSKYDVEKDVTALYEASKGGWWGWGTEEEEIFQILETRTNQQIEEIRRYWNKYYEGQDFDQTLKNEFKGMFESGLQLEKLEMLLSGEVSDADKTLVSAAYAIADVENREFTSIRAVLERINIEEDAAKFKDQIAKLNEKVSIITGGKNAEEVIAEAYSGHELNLVNALFEGKRTKATAIGYQIALETKTLDVVEAELAKIYQKDSGSIAMIRSYYDEYAVTEASRLGGPVDNRFYFAAYSYLSEPEAEIIQVTHALNSSSVKEDRKIDLVARRGAARVQVGLSKWFGTDMKQIEKAFDYEASGANQYFSKEEWGVYSQRVATLYNGIYNEELMTALEDELDTNELLKVKALMRKGYLDEVEQIYHAVRTDEESVQSLRETVGSKTLAELLELENRLKNATDDDGNKIYQELLDELKKESEIVGYLEGDSRKQPHLFEAMVDAELSGLDEDRAKLLLKGKAETLEAAVERMQEEYEFTTDGIGGWAMQTFSNRGDVLEHSKELIESIDLAKATEEEKAQLISLLEAHGYNTEGYEEAKDSGKDAVGTGAALVASGVAVGLTFGTATPVVVGLWGVGAGSVAYAGAKAAYAGDDYDSNELGKDLAKGAFEGASVALPAGMILRTAAKGGQIGIQSVRARSIAWAEAKGGAIAETGLALTETNLNDGINLQEAKAVGIRAGVGAAAGGVLGGGSTWAGRRISSVWNRNRQEQYATRTSSPAVGRAVEDPDPAEVPLGTREPVEEKMPTIFQQMQADADASRAAAPVGSAAFNRARAGGYWEIDPGAIDASRAEHHRLIDAAIELHDDTLMNYGSRLGLGSQLNDIDFEVSAGTQPGFMRYDPDENTISIGIGNNTRDAERMEVVSKAVFPHEISHAIEGIYSAKALGELNELSGFQIFLNRPGMYEEINQVAFGQSEVEDALGSMMEEAFTDGMGFDLAFKHGLDGGGGNRQRQTIETLINAEQILQRNRRLRIAGGGDAADVVEDLLQLRRDLVRLKALHEQASRHGSRNLSETIDNLEEQTDKLIENTFKNDKEQKESIKNFLNKSTRLFEEAYRAGRLHGSGFVAGNESFAEQLLRQRISTAKGSPYLPERRFPDPNYSLTAREGFAKALLSAEVSTEEYIIRNLQRAATHGSLFDESGDIDGVVLDLLPGGATYAKLVADEHSLTLSRISEDSRISGQDALDLRRHADRLVANRVRVSDQEILDSLDTFVQRSGMDLEISETLIDQIDARLAENITSLRQSIDRARSRNNINNAMELSKQHAQLMSLYGMGEEYFESGLAHVVRARSVGLAGLSDGAREIDDIFMLGRPGNRDFIRRNVLESSNGDSLLERFGEDEYLTAIENAHRRAFVEGFEFNNMRETFLDGPSGFTLEQRVNLLVERFRDKPSPAEAGSLDDLLFEIQSREQLEVLRDESGRLGAAASTLEELDLFEEQLEENIVNIATNLGVLDTLPTIRASIEEAYRTGAGAMRNGHHIGLNRAENIHKIARHLLLDPETTPELYTEVMLEVTEKLESVYPYPQANYLPGGRKFEQWREQLSAPGVKIESVFSGPLLARGQTVPLDEGAQARVARWRDIGYHDDGIDQAGIDFFSRRASADQDPVELWEARLLRFQDERPGRGAHAQIREEKLHREYEAVKRKRKANPNSNDLLEGYSRVMVEARELGYPNFASVNNAYDELSKLAFARAVAGENVEENLNLASEAQAALVKSRLTTTNLNSDRAIARAIDEANSALEQLAEIEITRGNQALADWATGTAEGLRNKTVSLEEAAAEFFDRYKVFESNAAFAHAQLSRQNRADAAVALERLANIEWEAGREEAAEWAEDTANGLMDQTLSLETARQAFANRYPSHRNLNNAQTAAYVSAAEASGITPLNLQANYPDGVGEVVHPQTRRLSDLLSTMGPSNIPWRAFGRERVESTLNGRDVLQVGRNNFYVGDDQIAPVQFEIERASRGRFYVRQPLSASLFDTNLGQGVLDQDYLRSTAVEYGGHRYRVPAEHIGRREILLPAGSKFYTNQSANNHALVNIPNDLRDGEVRVIHHEDRSNREKTDAQALGNYYTVQLTTQTTEAGNVPLVKLIDHRIPEHETFIRKTSLGIVTDYPVTHVDRVRAKPGDQIVVKVRGATDGSADRDVVFTLPNHNDGLRNQRFTSRLISGDLSIAELQSQYRRVWRKLRNAGIGIQPAYSESYLARSLRAEHGNQDFVEGAAQASRGFVLSKLTLESFNENRHRRAQIWGIPVNSAKVWRHSAAEDVVELLENKGYQVVLEPAHPGVKKIVNHNQENKQIIIGPDTTWLNFVEKARDIYVRESMRGLNNVSIDQLLRGATTTPTQFSALRGETGFDVLRVLGSFPNNKALKSGLEDYFVTNRKSFGVRRNLGNRNLVSGAWEGERFFAKELVEEATRRRGTDFNDPVALELERLANKFKDVKNPMEFTYVFWDNQISHEAMDIIEDVSNRMGETNLVAPLHGDTIYDEMRKYTIETAAVFSGINRNLRGLDLAEALGHRAVQLEARGDTPLDMRLAEASPVLAEAVRMFKESEQGQMNRGVVFSQTLVRNIVEEVHDLHFYQEAEVRYLRGAVAYSDISRRTGETWDLFTRKTHLRPKERS